jgi:FMN phosphatase YigB (HAD superfamily)
VAEGLEALRDRGLRLWLVTFGDVATQEAKVRATAVSPLVDRVEYEALGPAADKGRLFREICGTEGIDPRMCAAIGDRPDAEIAAGKRLGMFTVRVKRGEHRWLDPRTPEETADSEVLLFPAAARLVLERA